MKRLRALVRRFRHWANEPADRAFINTAFFWFTVAVLMMCGFLFGTEPRP